MDTHFLGGGLVCPALFAMYKSSYVVGRGLGAGGGGGGIDYFTNHNHIEWGFNGCQTVVTRGVAISRQCCGCI